MEDLQGLSKHWFALFTASNNEKKVEKHLQMKEIETFLPLYTVTKRWKNRRTAKVELPLFAGYVFARFARTESFRVLDVPMVYSIVGNKLGALPLPDAEIEALRVGLIPGHVEPHPYVKIGQLARIRTGALAGWKGIVSRVDGGVRVVLTVKSINQSISVRVSADDLDLLGDNSADTDAVSRTNQASSLEWV
ncbi:transcription termination/antitermination protein NusG [Edaphobacter bradus]|uniref:transcription termination/antitermination protein NusG n=1 Tax=Edaphobacter bradus TaxID=2259016 RepID=UPI0021E0985F|nr:transcription termination/antitermination NusG family protein [Edaphobacter bradus]